RERRRAVVADHVAQRGEIARQRALEREHLVAEERAAGQHERHHAREHGEERELVAQVQVLEQVHRAAGASETRWARERSLAESLSPPRSAWARFTSKRTCSP